MGRVTVYRGHQVTTAIIVGDSSAMDAAAQSGLAIAKALAARHVETGHYLSSLKVEKVPGEKGSGRRVSDRLIVADDAGAASIEWGHLIRFENTRRVRWIPGQHILTNTKATM